jgi:amino acid transporter
LNGIWLSCSVAFLLGLPYLINSTAYYAVTSLCIICLHVAYGLPLLCKLFSPNPFCHGPFHLGRCSSYINTIALIWISLIVILFVLPPEYPVTPINMNYASAGFGTVLIVTSLVYILSARHWFKGPRANISASTNQLKSSTTNQILF